MANAADKGKEMLRNLTDPGKTLGEQTAKGGFWVSLLRIFERGLQLLRTIVLARILAPEDFGIYGIALLTLSVLETFTETGFQQALIQKKSTSERDFNAAWTVQVVKSALLAVVLFFGAPLAAKFFDAPAAAPLLRVISAAVLFVGLRNIAIVTFEKELKFSKYFQYRFLGSVGETIAAITAAVILRNVWALAIGLVVGNLIRCLMSYAITKFTPKFEWRPKKAKGLWGFGKWIFTSNIFSFVLTEGDDIVVGKLVGTEPLGFYQLAYRISNLPALEISGVISKVAFPAYASIQKKVSKLRRAFKKVLKSTAYFTIPISGYLFITAEDMTRLFLGEKWLDIVPALQILVWWGAIRAIIRSESSLFLAVGKPKLITILQIIQSIVMYTLLIPLTINGGFVGASAAVLIASVLTFFIRNYFVISELRMGVFDLYKDILLAMLITVLPIVLVAIIQSNITSISVLESFALSTCVFIVSYLLPLAAIDKILKLEILDTAKQTFFRIFKRTNVSKSQ